MRKERERKREERVSERGEQHNVGGKPEHVSVNLFPPVFFLAALQIIL